MITLKEALKHIISLKRNPAPESIALNRTINRILAENIYADRDYPPFNRSSMDGYAVSSEDILERHITKFKVISEVFAGENKNFPLRSGEAIRIMTGAVVPSATDVIIRKEEIMQTGDFISFEGSVLAKYQNIAVKGEDLKKDNLVIPKNVMINFTRLSLLASLGKKTVSVYSSPSVSIISTGDEIKSLESDIESYQVRDSNSYGIEGFLDQYSVKPARKIIAGDTYKRLKKSIEKCLDSDILIITGGVSEGDDDIVPLALKECGFEETFHKVRIKPGKPLWFGYYPGGTRAFALPGNPFSVQVACKIFVEPYLRACFNLPAIEPLSVPMNTKRTKRINGMSEFDEFFPAELIRKPGLRIQPVAYNGTGDITALTSADGIAHHPAEFHHVNEGDNLGFYPLSNL